MSLFFYNNFIAFKQVSLMESDIDKNILVLLRKSTLVSLVSKATRTDHQSIS